MSIASSIDEFDFTEDEIREQLEKLGYNNVPSTRLKEFKRDLEQLVRAEKSGSSGWSTVLDASTDSEAFAGNGRGNHAHTIRFQEDPRAANFTVNSLQGPHQIRGKDSAHNGSTAAGMQKAKYTVHMPSMPVPEPNTPGEVSEVDHSMLSQQGALHTQQGASHAQQPNTSVMDSSTASEKKYIKRRVLRKKDGQAEVTDELTESEMGDLSSLEERLQQMEFPGSNPYDAYSSVRRPRSSCGSSTAPSYRLPEDYQGLKALIRPMTAQPNARNVRKTDPVSQYQKYQAGWSSQRAPGEKSHKNLRWNVREHMLYHDEVVEKKSQKVFVPNRYVIPSDKKRKQMRWQMRQDMAAGIVPPSIFD